MAENPLLPGTDIEVVEKYAPGKRLDFPNFGSVCKSSFAKGVITDFKMMKKANCDPLLNYSGKSVGDDQVDPFRVKSMVKVTGNFGESEFIPLFYHPKDLMWDDAGIIVSNDIGTESTVDEGVLATDFQAEPDEDGDSGYFKKAWMSFRPQDEVAVMLKEGKPVAVLGFVDGAPRVGEAVFKVNIKPMLTGTITIGTESPRYVQIGEIKLNPDDAIGPDGLDLQLVQEVEPLCDVHQTKAGVSASYDFYYKEWLIILGPKLIVLTHYAATNADLDGTPSPYWRTMASHIYIALATKENIEKAQTLCASHAEIDYSVGLYDDTYNYIKDTLWDEPGFYEQSDLFNTGINLSTLKYTIYPMSNDYNMYTSVFTRPHTKEELEAAGLWPAA